MGTAVDSRSISLSWGPPPAELLNGILRDYQIDVVEEQTLRRFSVHTSSSHYLLSFLHPFYDYVVSVAAFTVGNGPFSNNITIETHQDGKMQTV